ncbi:hypothetical protein [Nocardioides daeguensis]|uniref:Uncharacterized protein n=1 Tax=Nocardioides daeguensis TaxID=908359 RepID=A0ABP6VCG1_9ACTN|nr:hypothetical protein [Nocardioides daeguensis]MBV6729402.1 hypothetical protein [Nocardioides daeguensis]MCR1771825.1 hypothetical protein [Nocardioides daeguensis]
MSLSTARRALAATVVAGVVPAPQAVATSSPGAIVYVKGHNVWLADGKLRSATGYTAAGYASDPGFWGVSHQDKPSRKDRGKRISVRLTISRPGLASTTWTSATKKVKR